MKEDILAAMWWISVFLILLCPIKILAIIALCIILWTGAKIAFSLWDDGHARYSEEFTRTHNWSDL